MVPWLNWGLGGTERISVAGDRKVRHTRQAEGMKEGPACYAKS